MAGLWNQREAYLKEFVTCSARRAVAAQRRLSQASASKSLVSIMWCFQRNLATTELNHRVRSPRYKEMQISLESRRAPSDCGIARPATNGRSIAESFSGTPSSGVRDGRLLHRNTGRVGLVVRHVTPSTTSAPGSRLRLFSVDDEVTASPADEVRVVLAAVDPRAGKPKIKQRYSRSQTERARRGIAQARSALEAA